MSESRWTPPMRASEDLTDEQRQRVQALRVAREVVEEGSLKGAFGGASMSANAAYLVETAEWIVNGTLPLSLREEADESQGLDPESRHR